MPNEYSDLLEGLDTPPQTNEYRGLVDPSAALVRAQNAEGAAPDEAAQTLAAAKRLGIPYAVGALDHRETQASARRANAQQAIVANPFIQDHIDNDPAAAQLSNDDWGKLDGFTKAWRTFTDPDGVGRLATLLGAPAINAGAQRGFAGEAAGSARALGNAPKAEAIDAQAQTLPQYPSGIAHYMDLMGGLVGQLGYQAATGGALGAAAGTPAGPAGVGVGFLGGIAAAASQAAYGRTLMAFDKAERESGQTVDPTAKHLAAGAIGLLSGGANYIGVKAGGEAVGSLLSEAAVNAMARPGVAAALGRFGKETAKGGATAAGLMGGLTLSDQVMQDAAKSVGGDWQTIYNDPQKREELVGAVGNALADGFVLGAGLHAIPAGRNAVNDMRLAKEAAADKDNLNALVAARTESATAQRSPESFQGYAALHGDEKIVITPEGVEKLPEELKPTLQGTPLRIGANLVDQDAARRAAASMQDGSIGVTELAPNANRWDSRITTSQGFYYANPNYAAESEALRLKREAAWLPDGSIEVPLSTYAAMVPEDVHAAIADDIIHRDDGLSVNEAKALGDRSPVVDAPPQGLPEDFPLPSAEGLTRSADGEVVGMAAPEMGLATPSVSPDPVALATTAAEAEMYLQPIFQGPAALLMQKGEFARYNKLLEDKANARHAALVRRAEADARLRQTPDYLAREADVREEVIRNVDDRPVFVADRLARTGLDADGTRLADAPGAFKLDRELVDAVSRPGTADMLGGLVKKGGLHPDELAGLTGFGSGAELVQELASQSAERQRLGLTPKAYREAVIKAEVQERMLDRFGDLDENVRAEALDAAVRPQATELLDAEREALATLAGGKPEVGLDQLRANAAAAFAEGRAADGVNLARYTRAVGRAGREAELALLKGDYAKAFLAKQRQMQAMLFAEQAKAFARDQARAAKRLEPYARNPTLEAVAQDYVDQVQGLLSSLGEPIRRDSLDLREALAGTSLPGFIAEKNSILGGIIPDADLPRVPYAEYTVADARQLADLVQALDYQGRQAQKLRVGEEQARLADVVKQAKDNLEALPDRFKPKDRTVAGMMRTLGRKIDAPLLKMEQLFEWFDKHDPNGPFHRYVVEPLHLAQGKRDDLFESLGVQLRALKQGKEWEKTLEQSLPNTTLMDSFTGKPMELTRKELLGIMLNAGNGGNLGVMVKGHGWTEQAVRDYITQHARAQDWKWVQGIWDTFKSLEPEIKRTYRELAGVGPEMIQPNKYFTPFGTVEGGYYPLIRDVLRDNKTAPADNTFMQRGQVQPFPANGYTKARTGAVYPVELNPDFIAAHLRATAHDLAFRGPVIEAYKFLMHPEIQEAVKRTFGPEYAGEFLPYLKDIANDGVSDLAGISYLNRMSAGARNSVVAAMIGLNPGTVMIHGMSAGFNSVGELTHQFGFRKGLGPGIGVFGRAASKFTEDFYNKTVGRMTQSPAAFNKTWEEAVAESAEMRNRRHNIDRDLARMQELALGRNDRRQVWNNWATGFVGYFDTLTAIPTYIAARDLALQAGKSREDAIAIGEKTVRQAHGSQGITDRARVQRGTEFQKLFTMFYGYFSHNYNRNRNTWREAMEGKEAALDRRYVEAGNAALKVTSMGLFYAMLPAFNHAWVRHPQGEDQSWMGWMAGALVTQFTGLFPVVRDFGSALVTGRDPTISPVQSAAITLANTAHNVLVTSQGHSDKVKPKPIRDAVNTAGLLGGVGVRQLGVGGQFGWDVWNNKEHPEGFGEWWRGLTTGHAKQRKHH